jgi:hypothetical protein
MLESRERGRAVVGAGPAADGERGVRPTRAVAIVWAQFALVLTALVVTYSRLPPRELYNVTGHGFVGGGLSRAVTYVNFPVGIAAVLLLLATADRMSRRERAAALIAVALWTPIFSPSVLSESHLDARWANAIPAVSVALALVVTLRVQAVRPNRVRGDGVRVALAGLLLLLALPWIAAELGFDFTDVPMLGQLFQTQELRHQPGVAGLHPAVHYGDHHGLEATLLVISALLVSRMLGAVRSRRLHAGLGLAVGIVLLYGVMNIANDAWTEQVIKRGWTAWAIPSVLEPRANWGWGVIVAGGIVVWLRLFTPRAITRRTGR